MKLDYTIPYRDHSDLDPYCLQYIVYLSTFVQRAIVLNDGKIVPIKGKNLLLILFAITGLLASHLLFLYSEKKPCGINVRIIGTKNGLKVTHKVQNK